MSQRLLRPQLLIFHFDLLQDVAVLRPLVLLAARKLPERDRLLLVSSDFAARDRDGTWAAELDTLSAEAGCRREIYGSPLDAYRLLAGRRGLVIAGSESSVIGHATTHRLFRALPPGFRSVTLQHGFECVGFLHNAAHDASVGPDIRFAADIVAGWFAADRLVSIPPADRSKLVVTGPPTMIEARARPADDDTDEASGLICENLHSVRFDGTARQSFADVFANFMRRARDVSERVVLRPHPAGRFTAKSAAGDAEAHHIDIAPLYRSPLGRSAYAISAPSTVVLDLVLADVPVAVWADDGVDARHFAGLFAVRTADDWWRFAQRARRDRRAMVEPQRRFVARLGIPENVADRYCRLMASS